MDSSATLTALIPELERKYERYCVADFSGAKLLNLAGFKYLLKSCPGVDLPDDDIPALFAAGARLPGGAASVTRKDKLSFDGFMIALAEIAAQRYGAFDEGEGAAIADPEAALASFVVDCVVPNHTHAHTHTHGTHGTLGGTLGGSLLAAQPPSSSSSAFSAPSSPSGAVSGAAAAAVAARAALAGPPPQQSPAAAAALAAAQAAAGAKRRPSSAAGGQSAVAQAAAAAVVRTVEGMKGGAGAGASVAAALHRQPLLGSPGSASVGTVAAGGPGSPSASSALSPTSPHGAGAGAGGSGGGGGGAGAFLAGLRLESFAGALHDFGAESVEDLIDVTEEELAGMGFKPLQRRRLREALLTHATAAGAAAAPYAAARGGSPASVIAAPSLPAFAVGGAGATASFPRANGPMFSAAHGSSSPPTPLPWLAPGRSALAASAAAATTGGRTPSRPQRMVAAPSSDPPRPASLAAAASPAADGVAAATAAGPLSEAASAPGEDAGVRPGEGPEAAAAAAAEAAGTEASASASASAAQPAHSAAAPPPAAPVAPVLPPPQWEEYATADGYLYYHNAGTGSTQWHRPSASQGRVRTIGERKAEAAAMAAQVEGKVAATLAALGMIGNGRSASGRASLAGSPADGGSSVRGGVSPAAVAAAALAAGVASSSSRSPTQDAAAVRTIWSDNQPGVAFLAHSASSAAGGVGAAAPGVGSAEAARTAREERAASRQSGAGTPLRFREAQSELAADAKAFGIAYNSFEGLVEPLPSDAAAAVTGVGGGRSSQVRAGTGSQQHQKERAAAAAAAAANDGGAGRPAPGPRGRGSSPTPSAAGAASFVSSASRAQSAGPLGYGGAAADGGPLKNAPMRVTSTYARAAVLARHSAAAAASAANSAAGGVGGGDESAVGSGDEGGEADEEDGGEGGYGYGEASGGGRGDRGFGSSVAGRSSVGGGALVRTGRPGTGSAASVGGQSLSSSSSSSAAYMGPPLTHANAVLAAHKERAVAARAAAADVRAAASASASTELYPEVYASMPSMDAATFDAMVRAHTLANPRKMGYADPRPDIRPLTRAGASSDHVVGRVEFSGKGHDGKATAVFAGQLRQHLYTAGADPSRARTGADIAAQSWGGQATAPSAATTGYAYRHAAALSAWTGAGSVYDRLTDHRGYTGVHRARFDGDGRGRGMAGRDGSHDVAAVSASIPHPGQGAPYLMDNQRAHYAPPSASRLARSSSPRR